MKNNECRIIKIGKDALYEFIYENFIANHEEFMDMDAVGNMNTFAINWETGEFIFCAHKDENEKGEIVPVFTSDDLIQMFKNLAETGNEIDTGLETYSIEEANNKIEHFNSDKTKGEVVVQKHANGSKTIYVDGIIDRQINKDGSLEYFNPKNMLFEVTFPDGYTIKRKGEYISKEEVNKMHEKFVEEKARIENNLIKLKAAKMPFHLKDSTDIDFILSQITNDEQLERIDIMIGQHAFYNTCG